MPTRQSVAHFLFGLVTLPVCALAGLTMGLLFGAYFHWGQRFTGLFAAVFTLVPLAGVLRPRRQAPRSLLLGMLAGLLLLGGIIAALRAHP